MADANLKINVTADTKSAESGLSSLTSQTESTGMGIGALGGAAAIGGAALIALGTKSVMAFQDLGITVGKFSDATGISAEESSRLIEVAGDVGISSETLQAGIVKMSKALGESGDGLAKYGIEAVRTADGNVDMNATFLKAQQVISDTKDPLKKAEIASAAFGKGFASMSELTSMSAGDLKASLADVSGAKIFDDEKVNKAKDLRAGFDAISDAGENLFLTIGNALAPVVATLATKLGEIIEKVEPLASAIGGLLVAALELVSPLLDAILAVLGPVVEGLSALAGVVTSVGESVHDALTQNVEGELGFSLDEVAASAKTADEATADLAETEEQAKASAEAQAKAQKELEAKLKATEKALQDDLKAQEELTEAFKIGADTSYALADAQDQYATTVMGLDQAVIDAGGNQAAINKLYRDATQDAAAVANATVELNANQAEMNGTTYTAAQRLDDFNGSMLTAAASATGPLKQSIIDYIATTNGIPASKMTEIQSAIDKGDIETANRILTEASKARTVAVKADADEDSIAEVNRQLDAVAQKSRIAKVTATVGKVGAAFASGGTTDEDGTFLVGERGPELAQLPANTKITNANSTRNKLIRSMGETNKRTTINNTYVTNNNFPPSVSVEALNDAQRRRERRGLDL